jgi:hypothetical protein
MTTAYMIEASAMKQASALQMQIDGLVQEKLVQRGREQVHRERILDLEREVAALRAERDDLLKRALLAEARWGARTGVRAGPIDNAGDELTEAGPSYRAVDAALRVRYAGKAAPAAHAAYEATLPELQDDAPDGDERLRSEG